MISINPKNNTVIDEYEEIKPDQIDRLISASHNAWTEWKLTTFQQRAKLLNRLANQLRENKHKYAKMITSEMGKVLTESLSEIEKCATVCEYYAENGESLLQSQSIDTEASLSKISYQPLGVVFAVMPWNFPFWQVFRFLAPTLMAGNVGVLKHASNVTQCAMAIEDAVLAAGFAPYVFKTILISSERVNQVIENSKVKAVTLTGSTAAGKAIAAKSGEMLKKTVLELGGSDPYIILEGADIEHAVQTCVKSRMLNGGQSCISAKRFIIVESIYEEFRDRFVELMSNKVFGDPLKNRVDLGPMARRDLRDELHNQVMDSVKKGAILTLGGKIPSLEGSFYPPTVLENVSPGMPAYNEELFGPVAALVKVKDLEEAIQVANDTDFGLGASIFTRDTEKGKAIAETRLEAGCCFVNELVHSDPRLPFGGIKQSGYGRELGPFGIREFVNAKTVYVK